MTRAAGHADLEKIAVDTLSSVHVSSLSLYPLKSSRGVRVDAADVELSGLVSDRRWAVVGRTGKVITARENDRLLRVTATTVHDAIELSAPFAETVRVPNPVGGPLVPVSVSRMPEAIDAGDAPASWLSTSLRQPVRLVWQDDPRNRTVSTKHGGAGGDPLNLSDAGPILLTTTTSLECLNGWIAEQVPDASVPMERFRPNIVVEGSHHPFEEDGWRRIRIGNVEYRYGEICDRCVITTIDPATLTHGPEPIRTLARHRRWEGKTWFGIRLIPVGSGTARIGDDLEVLEKTAGITRPERERHRERM